MNYHGNQTGHILIVVILEVLLIYQLYLYRLFILCFKIGVESFDSVEQQFTTLLCCNRYLSNC